MKKANKKAIVSFVLCICMMVMMFSTQAFATTDAVTLNVADGRLKIYPDGYIQDTGEKIDFKGRYIFTGTSTIGENILFFNSSDKEVVYDVTFDNLNLTNKKWASCITIGDEKLTPTHCNIAINFTIIGENIVSGHTHPGIYGHGAKINFNLKRKSKLTLARLTPGGAIDSVDNMTIKNSDAEIFVAGEKATLSDAITNNPLVIQSNTIFADYSEVDKALDQIPKDLSLFTGNSVEALNSAKSAVILNKKIAEQELVDGYADSIIKAIAALIYKDADYSKIDELISTVPKDLSIYTAESVANLQKTLSEIKRDFNITNQNAVDKYEDELRGALAQLVEKNVSTPNTGDNTNLLPCYLLLIISSAGILFSNRIAKKKEQ